MWDFLFFLFKFFKREREKEHVCSHLLVHSPHTNKGLGRAEANEARSQDPSLTLL